MFKMWEVKPQTHTQTPHTVSRKHKKLPQINNKNTIQFLSGEKAIKSILKSIQNL